MKSLSTSFKFIYTFVIALDPLTFDQHQPLTFYCSQGNKAINNLACSDERE